MRLIQFAAPIVVVPKGRPRVFRNVTITPKRTRNCERDIALAAAPHFTTPFDGPIRVDIVMSKARGDIDNRIKTVLDAGNGIMWKDDSQVMSLSATIRDDRAPYLSITVRELLVEQASRLSYHMEEQ